MSWRVVLSRQAAKDAKKLRSAGLRPQGESLLRLLEQDPYRMPPRFEKLRGNLEGFYSRRINLQHRLVYRILDEEKVVHVQRMWTHYE